MRRVAASVVVLALLAAGAGCGGADRAATDDVRRVVVDTDMGADDIMALLYLARRPDVEIAAVTVSGTGTVRCPGGVRTARAVLATVDRGDVPVACGATRPLAGGAARVVAEWRDQADALYGVPFPDPGPDPAQPAAPQLLVEAVRGGATTILALGPMTNLAAAVELDPGLVGRVDEVYAMAGAVAVPGNVVLEGRTTAAEWNVYSDPAAADRVLRSGLPLTLVPLDATNAAPVDVFFYEALARDHRGPAAAKLHELLTIASGMVRGGFSFWDPVAAVVLVDERLAELRSARLTVTDTGQTLETPAGTPVRVASSADGPRFEQTFLDTLNDRIGRPSAATPFAHAAPDVRVVAAGGGCRVETPVVVRAGDVTVAVASADASTSVALARINGSHGLAELASLDLAALPPWLQPVGVYATTPGAEPVYLLTLGAGRYAAGCVSGADLQGAAVFDVAP